MQSGAAIFPPRFRPLLPEKLPYLAPSWQAITIKELNPSWKIYPVPCYLTLQLSPGHYWVEEFLRTLLTPTKLEVSYSHPKLNSFFDTATSNEASARLQLTKLLPVILQPIVGPCYLPQPPNFTPPVHL